jgi:hypothetical protein
MHKRTDEEIEDAKDSYYERKGQEDPDKYDPAAIAVFLCGSAILWFIVWRLAMYFVRH